MRVLGWPVVFAVLMLGCDPTATATGSGSGATGQSKLAVHLAGNGAGAVRATAFSCASDCAQSFAAGTALKLVAVPAAGSSFSGWQGDCSGTGECDLTLDADHAVTATFTTLAPPPAGTARVSVAFAGNGIGRVTSSPVGLDCPGTCNLDVPEGTSVSLTAQASAGSHFVGWGGACSGPSGCSIPAGGALTAYANFEADAPPPPSGNSCAGIAGPDDVAMQQYAAPQRQVQCLPAAGDAFGTLAFPARYQSSSSHGSTVDFVTTGGKLIVAGQYFSSEGPNFLQQPHGLAATGAAQHMSPYRDELHIASWNGAGASTEDLTWFGTSYAAAANPNGGVFVAGDLRSAQSGTPQHSAVMFNGGGDPAGVRWGPVALASTGAVYGSGVDALGRALVITEGAAKFGGGNISGQWFDTNGTALTGEFVLVSGFSAGSNTWFETSPLIGGGLVVRRMDGYPIHAQALVTVASGSTSAQAAPGWMTSRADTRLQIARGGKAYAVIPYAQPGGACSAHIEVVAPDGTSCGARDYTLASGTCDVDGMTLGEDGTLIQPLPLSMENVSPSNGAHTCTYRWWTGALK